MDVGILIIGNEILSGNIPDVNIHFLARHVYARGAQVREVAVVPDEIETIADKVREFAGRFDLVFTTGGIGPTHDDVTYEAVAQGLDRELEDHAELLAAARRKLGELNAAARKLARVPVGAELLPGGRFHWPPVKVANVVVLPGIPKLIEAQFPALEALLPMGHSYIREVRCYARETDLAEWAAAIDAAHPDVEVGSYPVIDDGEHYVIIRFSGATQERVEAACAAFDTALPASVRHDPATWKTLA